MKLYYSPISPYSMKVLLAFYEKHMSIPMDTINLGDPVQRGEYQKIYPFGKVPLLETEDGTLLPESSLIVEYFDEYDPPLIPKDKKLALHARHMDRMIDLYLTPHVAAIFLERLKPYDQQDQKMIKSCHAKINLALNWLEERLIEPWLCGDTFSIADCAALGPLYFVQNETELTTWPKLHAYTMRLIQRASSKKLLGEVIQNLNSLKTKTDTATSATSI